MSFRQHGSHKIQPQRSLFGGPLLAGAHARSKRPVGKKSRFSISLFANEKYLQSNSLLLDLNKRRIHVLIRRQCRICKIKLYAIKILKSEIHIELQIKDRSEYQKFIRSLTGLLCRKLLGRERGPARRHKNNTSTQVGFWRCRPLTFLLENKNWQMALLECQKQLTLVSKQILFLADHAEEWTIHLNSTA